MSALTMLGGAALALACGALNGSWVVPTKANAPKVLRVTDALPWEAFWFIFNISLIIFNGIVTMSVQGSNLFRALSNTSSLDLGMICLCFLGWGVGATGYGLSVKRVGVALGTALVLSAATIVGTILPVILDFGEAMEQIWFLFAGVLVAVAGFAILGKANLMKDADLAKVPEPSHEASKEIPQDLTRSPPGEEVIIQDKNSDETPAKRVYPVVGTEIELKTVSIPLDETIQCMGTESVKGSDITPVATHDATTPVATTAMHAACIPSMHENPATHQHCLTKDNLNDGHEGFKPDLTTDMAQPKISEDSAAAALKSKSQFWVNIGIAVLSGVTRALLNVGLVLGKVVKDQGQELGDSEIVSGMAVWFLGFNMCAIPGILFSAYLLSKHNTWGKLKWHESALTLRRLLVSMGSALTWVVLLHLYGIAAFWLGPLGNAIAWPLLLASTILSAQFWSQAVLCEWKGVSTKTKRVNAAALCVLMLSVIITATGVFVDEV